MTTTTLMERPDAAKAKAFREKARKNGLYTNPNDLDDEPVATPTPSEAPITNSDPTPAEGRVDDDANLTPEEKVYKKRYGDLRTLHQRDRDSYDKRIKELEGQIASLKNSGVTGLPKSAEEIKAWATEYPDLASAIAHIAEEKTKAQLSDLQAKIDRVEAEGMEVLREKAYLNLKKIHPDVDEIRASQDFHDWVTNQPSAIQAWFYDNDTDYLLAAKGIDLFKAETGSKRKKVKDEAAEVGNSERVASTKATPPASETGKKVWKASEIKRMSPEEFEKYESEIEQANYEGRVVNDLKDIHSQTR